MNKETVNQSELNLVSDILKILRKKLNNTVDLQRAHFNSLDGDCTIFHSVQTAE